MENLSIELHDSHVLAVRTIEAGVVIAMALYLHSSPGVPGVDPHTGWLQAAELLVRGGTVEVGCPPGRLWILDGDIQVEGDLFENTVPLPFAKIGRSRVHLTGGGWSLVISGTGVEVSLKGERVFLEDVP